MLSDLLSKVKTRGFARDVDLNAVILLLIGLLIVAVPLELGQLAFAFIGAICYAALQSSRKVARTTLKKASYSKGKQFDDSDGHAKARNEKTFNRGKVDSSKPRQSQAITNAAGKQEYWQASSQPVIAPTFSANEFEAQVQELLGQILPSAGGNSCVQDIAAAAKKVLHNLIPEADVMGFACGDVLRGTAFAVAIPEVDIILSASPSVIVQCLENRVTGCLPHASKLDARKLQKTMLRACTDELTAASGFKFRRSAFKGQEPKVTLMAEINGRSIPIDFSVNTTTPLYNAALLTECGQIEPRAKELILLVRRWAKDRGICHAAKGHLAPYVWSLLTIYFLQVWDGQDHPLLPQITAFKMSSGLLRKQQKQLKEQTHDGHAAPMEPSSVPTLSVARLFEEFLCFYTKTFNWRNEVISVRAGKRQPPATALPLHIVTLENGLTDLAPCIEDPFEPKRNLSDAMTGVSLTRLREELSRAQELCATNAPLGKVIEPWAPPEPPGNKAKDEQ